MAQVVECVLYKHEALSSNAITPKNESDLSRQWMITMPETMKYD
jgi:hypothetical protein